MDFKLLGLLLISSFAFAGFPPTTVKDSLDATPVVTFNLQFPNFTGVHTSTTYSLGVNGIAGGGTGQTTANAALNALLPPQGGRTGNVLQTDGTNTSWAGGVGSVTSVSLAPGSIGSVTNPNTTPLITINQADAVTNGFLNHTDFAGFSAKLSYGSLSGTSPITYDGAGNFSMAQADSGTNGFLNHSDFVTFAAKQNTGLTDGWIWIGDGSNTATEHPMSADVSLSNTGAATVNTVGGVPAATIATGIVNTANTLASYNSIGLLGSLAAWSVDPDYASLTSITSPASGTVADFWQLRTQTNLSSTVTGTARSLQMSLNNSATSNSLIGAEFNFNLPVATNATLLSLGTSSSTTVGGDLYGLNVGIDSPVTSGFVLMNAGTTNTIGGDYTGYYLNAGNTVTGSATLYSGSFYGSTGGDLGFINVGSSGNSGNNFRASSLSNNGTVAQFGSGYSVSQSGVVTKGYDAFSANVNANVGDGSGVNLNFMNATVGSGVTVDGSLFLSSLGNQADVTGQIFGSSVTNSGTHAGVTGWYLNNSGNMTGNNNFYGTSINNSGTGYNFTGANYTNNGAMTEQFMGVSAYDNGGARTASGASFVLQGTYADDARGLKVDVSGATSTNQQVRGLEVTGGRQQIYGTYPLKSGAFIDIGSYFAQTSMIPNGSPLTGTDMFMQLIQSNLDIEDDISGSPLGLDTNMVGAVSQLSIGSGKTAPLVRSMIIGTSIPAGSGGTLTEHVVLELLGLPSFGGSVTNPTRVGLQDSILLGQNFCDGATDCWFIRERDTNARIALAGPVNTDKGVRLSTSGAQPTCDAAHRGLMWNVEGGAGVADLFQVCQKDAADVYGWVTH